MLPFMQPGEIDRAIAGAAERKRAREAAARMMGFASYAAYHLQRWHHEGRRISDIAEESRWEPERHPEGGRELAPGRTLVGWSPCDCTTGVSGHRTYTCQALVGGRECGLVLSFPPCHDPSAGPMSWD